MNKIKKTDLKKLVYEIIESVVNESIGLSADSVIPIDKFVQAMTEASDMLGASTRVLPPEEMQDYLGRVADKNQKPTDKYDMPFVHSSNIPITNEAGKKYDLDKLRSAVTERPAKLLKQNEKITHSGGDSTVYFNLGLPALKGLAVNEKTGDFVIVDTCPGAGACKVYCYAKRGGYVQWKASSISQTRILNYLVNDPEGFKNQVIKELRAEEVKYGKKKTKLVVRWHDAGDFFSDDYLKLAYSIANEFPNVDFYAYTKMAGVATSGNKPKNFQTNFSGGATPEQEKQIDFSKTKHSTVVPKQMFKDYVVLEKNGCPTKDAAGKMQWKSPEAVVEFKKKLALKHQLDVKTVITYSELMKQPVSNDKKWNVIVAGGDGDDSANRPDVLGTYLLFH